jgi:DUF4097 and DUF4098 domain-containing protein YvlB
MKQIQAISLMIAAAAVVGGGQDSSSLTRDGRFWLYTVTGPVPLSTGQRFHLETTGNVVLRGETGRRPAYTLKLRVQARDAREAEQLFHQLTLRNGNQNGWVYFVITPPRRIMEAPELTISVPRGLAEARIETRGGNLQASGLDGSVEAHALGGKISVDGIRGRAEVRTGGGDIQVGTVNGPVRCYSGGGVIRVQNAGSECWLETAGGEIFLHQSDGPVHASTAGGNIRVERAAGAVFAKTAGGLIDVQQADGLVTAESSGGAIQVSAAGGVRCDSAGGAIRLRNVAGALQASTSAGSILAELAGGRSRIQDSNLSANAGDVTVLISSNLAVTVSAKNQSGGAGRIISDFPEIRVKPAAAMGPGPAVAEGSLNGGGPLLRINVVGGTIYLRKQK